MTQTLSEHLVNYGVLGILVAFMLVAIWKIGGYAGAKVVALIERYVESTEKLHDTLQESDALQKTMCAKHAGTLDDMAKTMCAQTAIAEKSCVHLEALVEAHNGGWHTTMSTIHDNNREIQRVRKAALQACALCRTLAAREFPNSSAEVAEHCTEIERIIKDA